MAAPSTSADQELDEADVLEEEANTKTEASGARKPRRQFARELRSMLYGCGDHTTQCAETLEVLEDVLIAYISEMTRKALDVAAGNKLQVEHILFLLRHDPRKYSRVKELLILNEELRKARKAFSDNDVKL